MFIRKKIIQDLYGQIHDLKMNAQQKEINLYMLSEKIEKLVGRIMVLENKLKDVEE
jgi:hypothetical protein